MKQSIFKFLSVVTCFATANLSVPYGAVLTLGTPLRESLERSLRSKTGNQESKTAISHMLTAKQQRSRSGKAGECPYLAGSQKWAEMHDGADLTTGNFEVNTTDLAFEGGYGIPVEVTRSYSANAGDEGPFGIGWALSADVRTTAGGLLKSPAAPIRTIPVIFKERHSLEGDPNIAVQPAAAVTASDSTGRPETIQRDVDGILTQPGWDPNISTNTYTNVQFNGGSYQIQTSNVTTTPDGTVYTYAVEGSYPTGTVPYGSTNTPAEPANVLKCTQAADRQGNVTTYTYSTDYVTFNKLDGRTSEHRLLSVQMPNGHTITFTWGNGTNAPVNRIVSATDGIRTVSYGYTNSYLTSVTTPGGKTTTFGYGAAATPPNWTGGVKTDALTSITTPQGATTTIEYVMGQISVLPYQGVANGVYCYKINMPNGVSSNMTMHGLWIPSDSYFSGSNTQTGYGAVYEDIVGITPTGLNEDFYSPRFLAFGGVWANFGSGTITINEGGDSADMDALPIPFSDPTSTSYTYDLGNNSLLEQVHAVHPFTRGYYRFSQVTTDTTYNFLGSPLSKVVTEWMNAPGILNSTQDWTRTYETDYAYWDATKYWQQKAVRDQAGRYSYTDYYTNTAAAGSRGQQYQVFDNAHAGFYLDTTVTPPSYAATADYWKYQLKPIAGQYTGQLVYDSLGRCTDVYKLQNTAISPWSYVHAQTTYGTNTDGSWGQASRVVEDVGGINRTTQNLHYTSWGKADQVIDAAGHQFNTLFDLDGLIQSVTRVDSGLNQTVASYIYGTTPGTVMFGQPISITDGLSAVNESVTYGSTIGSGSYGQVTQVTESGGPNPGYTVNYGFDLVGDRSSTTYTTPNATSYWQYLQYRDYGDGAKVQRKFLEMKRVDSAGNQLDDFTYLNDSDGRLERTLFGYGAANSNQPTLTSSLAYYPGGQIVWSQTSSSTATLYQDWRSYEFSGLNRGLTTGSQISYNGTVDHTESYSYDQNFDYLTGANYGDGMPNATPSWSYDAAGNRTDSACDNLNRTTSIGGTPTTCDILGNRLSLGSSVSFGWDCVNRMTSYSSGGVSNSYWYRADGMRVGKLAGGTGTTTLYRYDGQMCFEDVDASGIGTVVNEYGIGGKGIDCTISTNGTTTTVEYPIYDAHGNMVSTAIYNGSSYTLANQRSYDAWGNIRRGSTTGDPKGRYCGNLGHKHDDESGMVYMRARYYEPASGRFMSQDRHLDGGNWFIYCRDNPISYVDATGCDIMMEFLGGVIMIIGAALILTAAVIIGIIILVIGLIIFFYAVIHGMHDANEANENIQKLERKSDGRDALDPEEMEGLKNSMKGSLDLKAVQLLNLINQIECLEWIIAGDE